MRGLTAAQKRVLDKWFLEFGRNCGLMFDVGTNMDFSPELWDAFVKLNDYETLYQDVNRYISDKVAKEMSK